MKKIICAIIALTLILVVVFVHFFTSNNDNVYRQLDDLNGKTIGVQKGTIYEDVIKNKLPKSKIKYYDYRDDLYDALINKQIDAFAHDEATIVNFIEQSNEIELLPGKLNEDYLAFALNKNKKGNDILVNLDEYIDKINNNGHIKKLYNTWFNDEGEKITFDFSKLPSRKGKLIIGVEEINEPFIYKIDGKITGYEINILYDFCAEYGYGMEIHTYTFDELLKPNEKIDIRASSISITEERKELFNFSKSTYENNGALAVLKRKEKQDILEYNNIEELNGKKIGILLGSVFEGITNEYLANYESIYYDDNDLIFEDLSKGKIDGFVFDEFLAKEYLDKYDNLKFINKLLSYDKYGFAFRKEGTQDKLDEFNNYLKEITKNGELKKIDDFWMSGNEIDYSKVDIDFDTLPNINGELNVLTMDIEPAPFLYKYNDKYVGYEADILYRFAKEKGYSINISARSFTNIFDTLNNPENNFDVLIGCVTINEERKQYCNFSKETYVGGIVAVVRNSKGIYE